MIGRNHEENRIKIVNFLSERVMKIKRFCRFLSICIHIENFIKID